MFATAFEGHRLRNDELTENYDLLVVGGGSGGLAHAQRAAEYGARVAVVEYAPLGGTCVNVGCVPKKIMWQTAQFAHHFRHADDYGFDLQVNGHNWAALKERRDKYIERLNGIYQRNLDNKNIDIIIGRASMVDANSVEVDGRTISAERIAIATGGYPMVPDLPGAELGITSDGFFELDEMPQRVALAGSGYIAVELAGVFHGLGADTTILVRKDGVLRSFDSMLREELQEQMAASGIRLETGVVPESLNQTAAGLHLIAQDGRRFGDYDALVWAVGRAPNTASLNLEAAGVHMDNDGFIPVDDYQQTNVENIYALGDVTGREALTPVAIAAGRRLSDRLWGGMPERYLEYRCIPTVVFSHPPIGTVGVTEDEARAVHGDAVKVYRSRFTSMFYALGEEKVPTTMKLIVVGDEERIVGCHIIGDGADEILQGFAVAIRMGATKKDFDDTIAIHPTTAEELVTMR